MPPTASCRFWMWWSCRMTSGISLRTTVAWSCVPKCLKDNPPLRQALVELAGRFTDLTMRKLNYQVDGDHRPVRDVAEQFLREAGLLR